MAQSFGNITKMVVGILVFFFLLIFLSQLSFIYTVKYGQAAIINRFGKIERIAEPGLHFKIPIAEGVETYSTQKIIYETSESSEVSQADYKDSPVDTSTEDGQQISIRYTIRFQLNPKDLKKIAENLGTEDQIIERIVKAESRSVVRNIARKYRAQDLYTGNIFDFQKEVYTLLNSSFTANGLLLDEFLVRQTKFSPEYVEAVEQKQIENERVKTEEYRAEQEKFKKAQAITRAEGEAKAQEILRLTIDPLVLQKMAIEKWNGVLPQYTGASQPIPFIGR